MQTETEVKAFLCDQGWGQARRAKIAADFSTRLFERLTQEPAELGTAILMLSEEDQKTEAFVHMAALLRRLKVAAPEIYASDVVRGIVLMEDFGDITAGAALDAGHGRAQVDLQAAQLLAKIHSLFSQTMLGAFKVPLFNAALLTDQATLFLDAYFPCVYGRKTRAQERRDFVEAWHGALSALDDLPRSLLLRDFMPDNMMLLTSPVLGQAVGVLDFQDAGIGPVAYDVASWCEEVRRDGGLANLESFVAVYHALHQPTDYQKFLTSVRICAAKRHIRVLGRLAKLGRLTFVPRVKTALRELMKDPALKEPRRWFILNRVEL